MKKYIAPMVKINSVSHVHEVICSSPQVWPGSEADPDSPVLAPKRDKDWDDFH